MAMTCIQTALWYQCYFLVYTIMARSPSRPDSRLRASLPRISSCHPRALRQQDPFTYKLEATFKTYYTQGVTPGEVEHLFMHEYNRTGREYYLTFSPDSWISNYESTTIAMNVLNAASRTRSSSARSPSLSRRGRRRRPGRRREGSGGDGGGGEGGGEGEGGVRRNVAAPSSDQPSSPLRSRRSKTQLEEQTQ